MVWICNGGGDGGSEVVLAIVWQCGEVGGVVAVVMKIWCYNDSVVTVIGVIWCYSGGVAL